MKIHEAEALLGISKANIRFYERQGLLSPGRTEKGYRIYSQEDISRLKQIIILRKLDIPLPQIAGILDGALPIGEAMDANISRLQAEIDRLSGALALCRQLRQESASTLDTERYWDLVRQKEEEGMTLRSLAEDYLSFADPVFRQVFWFRMPARGAGERFRFFRAAGRYGLFLLGFSLFVYLSTGHSVFGSLLSSVLSWGKWVGLLALALVPFYLFRKK